MKPQSTKISGKSHVSNQETKNKIEQDSPSCRNTVTLSHTGVVNVSPKDKTGTAKHTEEINIWRQETASIQEII